MTEKTELAVLEEPQEKPLVPVASAEDLVEAMKRFEEIKGKLLVRDRDTYTIENVERIRKSGWRKLALAFGVSDEIVREDVVHDTTDPSYLCVHTRVKAWARGGRTVEGTGTASSRERKFAHLEHDLHALAHTRAKSRAIADMLGSSDLVAEELEEPEQAAPKAPTPTPPAPKSPGPAQQQRVDAGQRAVAIRFLEEVLGDDLVDLIKLEEKDGDLRVVLPAPMAEANRTRFLKGMMKFGQGVFETSDGLVARMKAPKAPNL